MAIGERIRFLRNLRGMTQKHLGMAVGFDEKTADIRVAQYESGTRTPKEKLVAGIAQALEVSPQALDVPDIESYTGLLHTLFALPFALVGYVWGVAELGGFGAGEWCVLGKVLLCMVFARNAAMGFNRVVDRRFDARNRRTAGREIPSGRISVRAAGWFVGANALAFIAAAGWLNAWTLALSPVALGVA